MPRKFFRKWAPSKEAVLAPAFMRPFAKWLSHPNLWHLNRRSVSGGVAIGLFVAFLPIPFQILLAVIVAVLFRVNVALAAAMPLLTNPFTIPPILWVAYLVGATITGSTVALPTGGITFEWVIIQINTIWLPILTGLLIMATLSAVTSYFIIQFLWRLNVILHKRRKQKIRARGSLP